MSDTASPLRLIGRLAGEIGEPALVGEADALAGRVAEGRFYAVCLGQFKRGKSSLLNALVGYPVLPAGIVPVTNVVTVLRHGDRLAARVRHADGHWQECEVAAVSSYVSEEQNPQNEKAVDLVEIFVPSSLLQHGLCLVDTPGVGSVWTINTAATRQFIPHVDAALVVLGVDPPLSGDELALLRDVAAQVDDIVVLLNKADLHSASERAEGARFAERIASDALGRPLGRIFEVSARERIAGTGPPRDWDALEERLVTMARKSGSDLIRRAETRGTRLIGDRLLARVEEREAALRRPLEESEARSARLARAIAKAERFLDDLAHRLLAVEQRVAHDLEREADEFLRNNLSAALAGFDAALDSAAVGSGGLRAWAVMTAGKIAERRLEHWRREAEPLVAERLRNGIARLVTTVNDVQADMARFEPALRLPSLGDEVFLHIRSRLYYTQMLWIAPESVARSWLERLVPRRIRLASVRRDGQRYLARLIEVNASRIKNDFRQRLVESRALLERELRSRLREVAEGAGRAVAHARDVHARGMAVVEAEQRRLASIRQELEQELERVLASQPGGASGDR